MNQSDNNQLLDEALQALPNELTPKRDLWAGIEQAVAKTQQDSQKLRSASYLNWKNIAAAFVPIAFLAGVYMNSMTPIENDLPWLKPISSSFEMQKQLLMKRVDGQSLVNQKWQDSLKDLELAEKSLIKALKTQPEDPALMKMLTHVYQQQLEIIAKSHQPKYLQI
ncbi:hypothetical protein [Psychrosphaera aestuarii]|uniref:hypothetical protein n=1 Tax=Psychrosphaera aestuarii TaxID=1266052 RepID=UPI001B33A3DE|nr:hypothetical protein [Psychrosphaera aestuarii]